MRLALHHPSPSAPLQAPRRDPVSLVPAVVEALAYLGGILGITGLSLLVGAYWGEMPSGLRIAVPAVGAALALVAAALVVHRTEEGAVVPAPFERMRAFLWLIAIAAAAVTGGVSAHELLDQHPARTVVALGAATALGVATLLWRGLHRPIPQAASMVTALVAVGTGMTAMSTGSVGLVLIAFSLCLVALGLQRLTSSPWITVGIAGAGLLVGSAMAADTWRGEGMLMIDATVGAMFVIALGPFDRTTAERRVTLAVALLGTWVGVPQSVMWFAEGAAVVTGGVVWATGLCIAAIAIRGLTLHARAVEIVGGLVMIGGAALTARESVALAVIWGIGTAVAMLAVGTRRFTLSVLGSLGLLIDVPWAILHFLPGERRAPIAILATGIILVGVAVVLVRRLGRRSEVSEQPSGPATS